VAITPENWAAVRGALTDVTERFGRILVAAADPGKLATKHWSVAETAAHVTGLAWTYTTLLADEDAPGPIPGLTEHLPTGTVDNLAAGFNTTLLRNYTERDPQALAERLRRSVDEILLISADDDPQRTLSWLGGSKLPVAGVLAHLMNEILVHGWDVARAAGAAWPIPEEYAALFIEVFLVEIIRNGVGIALDDDRPVRKGRIAVQFRSGYTTPVTIVLENGALSVEEPRRDDDVRVSFRPSVMDLVLFHRVANARAALTGALRLSGRRPWLLAPFLKKVRLP
jgi:uncharacterized protein (TIGR03083 family)